ncbi:substrate-binding domain-containing protein [Agromyces sp. NPDC056965]|uniref:substrate-binding domain-containing protein n=1 Tax=Agromyces sp. NPDC056965 TaxID=3345983 RepID=UPI003634BF17
MKVTKLLTAIAGAALVASALAACSGTAAAGGGGEAGPKIGLIMLQGDTYFQGIQSGLEAAVEADGGTVTTGLSNNDPATENQVAQNMIQAQMDAVLIQPTADEASLATMKAIKDAGIALICYGNCVGATADPDVVDGVIQSDNTALGTGTGEVAAAYATENLGDTVDLAILNCDVASACKLRKAGFLEALEAGGITVNIVTDQEAYLVDKATPVATDILTANPDIDMIWASNDGGTAGAAIAVKQAGADVPVFGTDISTQIADFLLDPSGTLQASTGQDPVGTAEGAYEMAKAVIAGKAVDPHSVELPGIVYDRNAPDTIDAFLNQ